MKKLRILLASLTVVLAVGAAFANQLTPTTPGYFFDNSNPLVPKCTYGRDCMNVSGPTCTSGTHILQNSNTPIGSSCGTNLKRD